MEIILCQQFLCQQFLCHSLLCRRLAFRQDAQCPGAVAADGQQQTRIIIRTQAQLPADSKSCLAFGQQTGKKTVGLLFPLTLRGGQTDRNGKAALSEPFRIIPKMQ